MYDRLDEVDRKAEQLTRLKVWIKKQEERLDLSISKKKKADEHLIELIAHVMSQLK